MNRIRYFRKDVLKRIPHASGDEPEIQTNKDRAAGVYPTRVGMNRAENDSGMIIYGIPHASGDEPYRPSLILHPGEYTPREWG